MILVVGGHPASGKSLLRRLCNSHPAIEMTDEFYCFFRLNVPYKAHISGLRKDWRRFPLVGERNASPLTRHPRNALFLARYLLGLQPHRQQLIQPEHVEQILRRIFPRAAIVGDVGPRYLFYNLADLVKSSAFLPVIIYRDCRDVAGHMASRPVKAPWIQNTLGTPQQIAEMWVKSVETMEQHAAQIHPIRYEGLVTHPQKTMAELGDLLGVEAHGFACQTIHANDIGSYKKWLSDEDIATILKIAGPTLERLGYKI